MSRRRLKPDELDLWHQVARTTQKMAKRETGQGLHVEKPKKPPIKRIEPADYEPLPRFKVGQSSRPPQESVSLPKTVSERLAQEPVSMDKKAFGRMKRGRLVPEARIDLHGMTLDQAHPALTQFILQGQMRGLRLVLVITGKGQRDDPHDPMPLRRGVLKRQVPHWLRTAPLSQAVLQVSEAHLKHGGSGAYYVYLKRRR